MYSINFIKNLIKECIDKKESKFIIYPFGMNGINTKNVLKDYFDLDPSFIVDNEYSGYNSKIIDKETLRNVYQQDMYILLTIENADLNVEILEELLEFVPSTKIINYYEKSIHRKIAVDGEGFLLSNFMPSLGASSTSCEMVNKIKVRIVHYTEPIWNSIKTICEAFRDDSLFDILLIGLREAAWVKNQGYNYITWDKYQIQEDRPDILILTNPYEVVVKPGDCRKYSGLIFAISGFTISYEASIADFWKTHEKGFGLYCPDLYLYDSLLYDSIKQSEYFSGKIVEMGNAKFDGIYQAMQEKRYTDGWEKLKEKVVVLWTTGHGVDIIYDRMKQVTFDIYA